MEPWRRTAGWARLGKRGSGAVDAVQAVADYGIHVAQLRDNPARPVAERLRRHQIALNTVELLRKGKAENGAADL